MIWKIKQSIYDFCKLEDNSRFFSDDNEIVFGELKNLNPENLKFDGFFALKSKTYGSKTEAEERKNRKNVPNYWKKLLLSNVKCVKNIGSFLKYHSEEQENWHNYAIGNQIHTKNLHEIKK